MPHTYHNTTQPWPRILSLGPFGFKTIFYFISTLKDSTDAVQKYITISRVIEFALMLQQNTLAFLPLCLQRDIFQKIKMGGNAFSTQPFVYLLFYILKVWKMTRFGTAFAV